MKISEVTASSLITKRDPVTYPDAARNANIQGAVVLDVIVAGTGDVKEVSVISGDPILAKAAADSLKQWKYKPYIVDGTAVEMETQVTINFHLKAVAPSAPALGVFRNNAYINDYFGLEYPLSPDWVRETQAMRKHVSASGQPAGMYVLLAAVQIPQQKDPLEADSSFILWAIDSRKQDCEQYLRSLASEFHDTKTADEKGAISPLTIASRSFYRAEFDFREGPEHRTFLCTQSKNYLLQWAISSRTKAAGESTIATIDSIRNPQPQSDSLNATEAAVAKADADAQNARVARVQVGRAVIQGLRTKYVDPIYPLQAKLNHIQGVVLLSAVINQNGDVTDLEALDGPIELVVSAVNAVRKWKYRPYMLNGEPVEVDTQITVNYILSR